MSEFEVKIINESAKNKIKQRIFELEELINDSEEYVRKLPNDAELILVKLNKFCTARRQKAEIRQLKWILALSDRKRSQDLE